MTAREPSAVDVIAEALGSHHLTRGMAVSMGATCACGEWMQGGKRTSGSDGLDAHRAEVTLAALSAAGYIVATPDDIRAEVWDEAVRECHSLGWMHDFALSDVIARNPYRGQP